MFAFLVLAIRLALIGLILFPLPTLKILMLDCALIDAGRPWHHGCATTGCFRIAR